MDLASRFRLRVTSLGVSRVDGRKIAIVESRLFRTALSGWRMNRIRLSTESDRWRKIPKLLYGISKSICRCPLHSKANRCQDVDSILSSGSAVSTPKHPITANGVMEETEESCIAPAIPHRDMVMIPPVMLHKWTLLSMSRVFAQGVLGADCIRIL